MSHDPAYLRIYVYDCAADQEQAVKEVLEHYLGILFEDATEPPEPLDLTDSYSVEEANTAHVPEFTAELSQAAPGASWVMWTDPADNQPGVLYAWTPAFGMYGPAECDAAADVIFTFHQIAAVLDGNEDESVDPEQALYEAMGMPWLDDWKQHTESEACS